MRPIAYTYEADTHCHNCTVSRFGSTEGTDSEGNQIGAIFSWDEWYNVGTGSQTLSCGTCGEEIDTYSEVA